MIAKLLNMTQGENSELEIIVNSGDTQAIAKLMNSVTSVLNKNSAKAGDRKKERSRMLTHFCLLYTSPSPRDKRQSRMPSSA